MIFVIAFGLEDKIRQGVNDSIEKLRDSNITVNIISGDHLQTAKMAAIDAGIIKASEAELPNVCMNGKDLMKILKGSPILIDTPQGKALRYPSDVRGDIEHKVSKCRVLARCEPEHKVAFIAALQTAN